MSDRSVYLLEGGLNADIPGLAPRTPSASFPFWGTAVLFDFAYAGLRALAPESCWTVADTRDRQSVAAATIRWGKGVVRQRDAENGLVELRRLVAADRSAQVFVSALSYAAFLDPAALTATPTGIPARRLRADTTAIPVYVFARERLIEELDTALGGATPEADTLRGFILSYLPDRVRENHDIPGKVFFVDNLMQLWDAHHFLREHLGGVKAARYIEALGGVSAPSADAQVTESGSVKDSLISSGAVIEGTVSDCVVFPGVVVRRGAQVHQSVIMTGARIAADAVVANTLILPWQPEAAGEAETVGSGAEIGESRSVLQTRNDDYPRHIARGVTLVAMNASVPAGVTVGAGCYVGPGRGGELRTIKRLERGASVR